MTEANMDNWLAFYIAVVWYTEITPEQARGQLEGKVRLAPCRVGELERETIEKIYRVVSSRKFSNVDKLEKKYRMHRCDICKAILQRYGGDAMSVCGDKCKNMGLSFLQYKDSVANIPRGERDSLREKIAVHNTNTAKTIIKSLSVGEKITLTYAKRTAKVVVISKNDRMLTIKDQRGRIDTINIADIITRKAKIQEVGA